jgi:hypothetical protein
MKRLALLVLFCCGLLLTNLAQSWQVALSAIGPTPPDQHVVQQAEPSETLVSVAPATNNTPLQPFSDVIHGAKLIPGLFNVYRNQETGKVYLEIKPNQLNHNFLFVSTLESGVGEAGLFSGLPLNSSFFQWRRVQNQVQFVLPNTNFRTSQNDPQRRSLQRSFSDSILYTLPIQSIHPQRHSLLVELNDLLLGDHDLAGLEQAFPWVLGSSYTPDRDQSYVDSVQGFPLNIELKASYNFQMGRSPLFVLETLPDPRTFNLTVRYSLSELDTSRGLYRPRVADERIGYFVTAYQDVSRADAQPPFVRYIQRWQLEPQDSNAPHSPAKEPIVLWIENTVPEQYRDAIREGALLWNTAFERIGIDKAIEVRQMPDNATWDPADVRYNTIRWSNSFQNSVLGIGPSRANPLTGEILDADIIIDANAVRFIQDSSEILVQRETSAQSTSALLPMMSQFCSSDRFPYMQWVATHARAAGQPLPPLNGAGQNNAFSAHRSNDHELCFGLGSSRQAAFGALSLAVLRDVAPSGVPLKEYTHQFLRWLVAHEVGHVLGLRHNFRGSTMLTPDQLNDTSITHTTGLVGSVMDYVPVNLAPAGKPQGDYFPTTLGPYDYWAVAYGYRPFPITPGTETRSLQQLAQRAAEPGLAFATDEDGLDTLDTEANLWDLSSDMVGYAQWQLENAKAIWAKLEGRYPLPGDSYSELRDHFNTVFHYYMQQASNITRYIGGQRFNRDRRGDPGGRVPFEFVPLDKQREALSVLQRYVFAPDAFQFSPDLLNRLAPSRWMHWGADPSLERLDYPIYDNLLLLQTLVLSDLLSSERLARLRDAELRAKPGEVLTLPELFETLQADIWTEVINPDEKVAISSLRRGLQRQHLNILINMTSRNVDVMNFTNSFLDFMTAIDAVDAPEDARALARYQLRHLQEVVTRSLRHHRDTMDISTRAHLEEISDRISQAIEVKS